ncbi:MAG: chemotaxis protein CheA [Pseudomonadota bacterium]
MDDLDLSELRDMFLEECRENVDVLEAGLLALGGDDVDPDKLNEIFRAAHSIKGGGATFGFVPLSELTHYMETLLDEMRSGNREVNEPDVELLLQSVDIVRDMLDADPESDHDLREDMQKKLSASVENGGDADGGGADAAVVASGSSDIQASGGSGQWSVTFKPKPELMTRGNDPLLLIRELLRLGPVSVEPDFSDVPGWPDYDPRTCYVGWNAVVTADVDRDAIAEIFEWVEFDCDVEITQVETSSSDATAPEEQTAPAAIRTPSADSVKAPADNKDPSENPAPVAKKRASGGGEGTTMRIATDKIDQLINLVGELVINQSMLNRIGSDEDRIDVEALRDRLDELERNTRELQDSVMRVRMLPLASGFSRLPRLVRDLSRKLEKKVELVVEGGHTEIDKTVLERMMDPLIHLVRNALDHGLETPEKRAAAGKPETGTLMLNAYHQSGSVIIEIKDDGAGINRPRVLSIAQERGVVDSDEELTDEQIDRLIFRPGFSTAETVSDVSGRGVGMDVVRRNIVDLGGRVDITSQPGQGTCITIALPLTLAILDGQLVRVGRQTLVMPLLSIVETVEVSSSEAAAIPGCDDVCWFRGEYVPLIDLNERFRMGEESAGKLAMIVDVHGKRFGLLIDEVRGQQQVVIKALEDNYRSVPGISGATIMSDGSVALILDPPSLSPSVRVSKAA